MVDDDQHLNGDGRRPEAREQAERDAKAAERLERDQHDGQRLRRRNAALDQRHLRGRSDAHHQLRPAVRDDHQPGGQPDQQPGNRLGPLVEGLELRNQQPRCGLLHVSSP